MGGAWWHWLARDEHFARRPSGAGDFVGFQRIRAGRCWPRCGLFGYVTGADAAATKETSSARWAARETVSTSKPACAAPPITAPPT